MTSNDAPASTPGDRPHRRRALGRGPGAVPPSERPAAPTGQDAPPGPVAPGPMGRTPAEGEETADPAEPRERPAQETPTSAPGAAVPDGTTPPPRAGSGSSRPVDGRPESEEPLAAARTAPGAPDRGGAAPGGPEPPSGPETDTEPGFPPRTPPRDQPDGSSRTSPPDVATGPAASHPGPPAPGAEPRTGLAPGGEPHGGAGRPGTAPERLSGDAPGTDPVRERHAGDPASPGPGGLGPGAESGSGGEGEDGDGRFKVRLSNFEGPFDLLLQLISRHKLDVTEVALSRVTDEFMAYIRAMGPDWDLDETTEFLVVAATLLDLKAARLLPAAEVEDEADLALLEARDLLFARLLQYRAYKRIAEIFSHRLDDEARRHPRTVGLEPRHAELLPEVVIGIGAEGFARLAVKAMQPRPKPQVYVDHIHAPLVSVQEQAGIVVARLRELGEARFEELVADTDDTLTVVARFLALLELYREKAVALDQETALGELTVRWTGGDGDAAPTVTDEFDRPPEQPKEERKA
ncbi:segregation and condensation protein A [Streptomyces albaduncus]|uniref:Segregation and condensation protein A n=1 Tax=Streptomyces griseoloalbus TaxID=67303 RepID=A0A7W8FAW1_9ACTN|nr:segregation and condensation protein A [Streptomyces albaduncus]GGW69681.1 hypothetical protein GCM10010340_54900 [Streptomyces albaduncus]